jgi:hypothetical protein
MKITDLVWICFAILQILKLGILFWGTIVSVDSTLRSSSMDDYGRCLVGLFKVKIIFKFNFYQVNWLK